MRRPLVFVLGTLLLLGYATWARSADREPNRIAVAVSGECRASKADEQWIGTSVAAWEAIRDELMPSGPTPATTALFFDAGCVYRADTLMLRERALRFRASAHAGLIELPSGSRLPIGPASFAAPDGKGSVFFVMALPSVWKASGRQFGLDLQTLLAAVMIHEMSHVVQFRTYLQQSAAVEGIELLGATVNDDIVQDRFSGNDSFSASVDEETRLLFAAADAASPDECRRLTKQALEKMRARQAAFYRDDLRALAKLEDIFLTLEGAGQFAALAWLIDPRGAGVHQDVARREFGESARFWSQRQGLALFLVLDRLTPRWRATVYGEGERTALQLLDEALSEHQQ